MHGLADYRVIDASSGIAGAYCAKLLADAGADVVKLESPGGDALRAWTCDGRDLGEGDGALFRFLHHGHSSVVGRIGEPAVDGLLADADLLIDNQPPGDLDIVGLRARHPHLVILTITPYGQNGPFVDRPVSELVIQAESGAIAIRGRPDQPPIQCGGRVTEWVSGTFASVPAVAAMRRGRRTGHGDHIDFSMAEIMSVAGSNYADLMYSLRGRPPTDRPARTLETPSIEPTSDGYVGFNTNTNQQFTDFLLMIERPDLLGDEALARVNIRQARIAEWEAIVRAWTSKHTTAEAVAAASALRIPVAPVCSGATVQDHDHFDARGVYIDDPLGEFRMPRRSWMIDFERPPAPRHAPRLGEHTAAVTPRGTRRPPATGTPPAPLAGIRVIDLTAWWAGPAACHMLASLGAEVVHVEAIQRLDGMRMTGGMFLGQHEQWWEYSGFFLQANTNKLGLTVDLMNPDGRELMLRMCESADFMIENFTPRVMDNFGLTWEVLHARNPRLNLVRMPAFGLDGPWRDRTGFAQTMEQLSGLAWLTGHVDDQPRIQRGPSDPNAGMHAAFAAMVALAQRDQDGVGHHIEATMIEGALNAAAEQVIEFTAYGNLLERDGNRSPWAAPQNVYACAGTEQWLALAVDTDEQWAALCGTVSRPDWAADPELATLKGRRAQHDRLDDGLRAWAARLSLDGTIAALIAAGVPAGAARDPRTTSTHPQLVSRGFYEQVTHPVVGTHPIPTVPFRLASREAEGTPWVRRPAPTLGQHNRLVLRDWVGLSDAEIDDLETRELIGTRPRGT